MAYDRIIHYPGATDVGLYAIIRNRGTGTVWTGTAMGAWLDASIGTYDVALTFLGGDAYGYTVPTTLTTGATYVAAFYKRASVAAEATITDIKLPDEWEFAWNGTTTTAAGPGTADWYYAAQADVVDLIGTTALRLISNEPDAASDAAVDTARLQRVGEWTDAFIDARMKTIGYVTPMVAMSAATTNLMEELSAKLVAWKLNEPRMLLSISSSRNANAISQIINEHRKSAQMTLNMIAWRQMAITATKLYTRPSYIEVYIPTWAEVIPVLP